MVAVFLVVVSLALGFGLYSVFFHPLSGEVRARYKGGRKRLAGWLKSHSRTILRITVIAAVALVLLFVGLRFGPAIAGQVQGLIPDRPPRTGAPPAPAEAQDPQPQLVAEPEAESEGEEEPAGLPEPELPEAPYEDRAEGTAAPQPFGDEEGERIPSAEDFPPGTRVPFAWEIDEAAEAGAAGTPAAGAAAGEPVPPAPATDRDFTD